jgi:hypothetical protein
LYPPIGPPTPSPSRSALGRWSPGPLRRPPSPAAVGRGIELDECRRGTELDECRRDACELSPSATEAFCNRSLLQQKPPATSSPASCCNVVRRRPRCSWGEGQGGDCAAEGDRARDSLVELGVLLGCLLLCSESLQQELRSLRTNRQLSVSLCEPSTDAVPRVDMYRRCLRLCSC